MNVYDSNRMHDLVSNIGYEPTETPEDAHLIVLNTCHIREKAAEKVYSELGKLKKFKDKMASKGEDTILTVAGCVAQAEAEEVVRRAPYVDLVIGPQTYQHLPDLVQKSLRARHGDTENYRASLALDFSTNDKFDNLPKERNHTETQGFLTIQEGCDKFCTFCVVPYTRGAEYSRPIADIVQEAASMVARGNSEITLLGQNVNAYHGVNEAGTEQGLAYLIQRLAELDGLERIRYSTSHPRDMDDALIKAHGDVPQLMPFLHLPVQSGSDAILKKMNRKHTAERYFQIIDDLRAVRSDMAFSSDFIVGFPSETDDDFEATMRMIERVNFAQAYSFKYSIRHGTPAAEHDVQVDELVKAERLKRLQALVLEQQQAFNQRMLGTTQPVLIEKLGRQAGQMVGRSPYMQAVTVEQTAGLNIGDIVHVTIEENVSHSLKAVPVDPALKEAA